MKYVLVFLAFALASSVSAAPPSLPPSQGGMKGGSAASAGVADYTREAVMPIFAFGETGASLGTGFAVGNGQYVVTTADNVMENLGPRTSRSVGSALVISQWTGDIHNATIEKVDEQANLALIKLERSGLPAAAFAESPREVPYATFGQLLNDNQSAGGRWPASFYSYLRETKEGRTTYALTEWRGRNAFITENRGRRLLFLKDVKPEDKAPGGGPVVRDGEGAVGVYVSRFIVEGGGSSDEQRLCVPLTETLKFLESAGLKREELFRPSEPTISKAEDAATGFQLAWRAMSNVVGANWDGAITDARALAEIRPKSAQVHLLSGAALAGAGKADEAIKALDRAVQIEPKLAGAYLNRGILHGRLGKTKDAEQDLRKAMELDPADARAPLWLSRLLAADEARRDEAVRVAEQTLKISPDSPGALLNLASALALNEDHERAIRELKRALEIAPNFSDARAALAAVYLAAGSKDQAEEEYRALVQAEPKNPAAILELAAFLAEQGKKNEAEQLISQALELDPPEPIKEAAEELRKKIES